MRVLIIEDEARTLGTLPDALQRLGVAVEIVATLGEGVAAQRERPADLVVLDLGLPDPPLYDRRAIRDRVATWRLWRRWHRRVPTWVLSQSRLEQLSEIRDAGDRVIGKGDAGVLDPAWSRQIASDAVAEIRRPPEGCDVELEASGPVLPPGAEGDEPALSAGEQRAICDILERVRSTIAPLEARYAGR
ncbi:MAG: hypothetical protein ACO4CT_18450 [Planctomycetota bacterium]